MTVDLPQPDCQELPFARAYALGAAAEVALEDYARVLARARSSTVLGSPQAGGATRGVHLCGVPASLPDSARDDVEAFARDLASSGDTSGGLGWS
jgi:hypothetical protein